MKRRGHRKSRHGCQECKRRHIKCDEGRPQCANCTITSRHCDFGGRRSNTRHGSAAAAAASPQPRLRAPVLVEGEEEEQEEGPPVPVPQEDGQEEGPPVVLPQRNDNTQQQPSPEAEGVVNLQHMELMAHYTFAVSNPEIDPDLDRAATKMVASQMQTQALHLFNRRGVGDGKGLDIDETNCAAAVLFSSTLGRHLLADTLEDLHQGRQENSDDSEAALDRYCCYLQVHHGLRAVASSSWSHLMESDLWPLIALAGRVHASRSSVRGTELRDLSRWVEEEAFRQKTKKTTAEEAMGQDTNDDDEEQEDAKEVQQRKTCLEAMDLLQIGLDESAGTASTVSPSSSSRSSQQQQHQMTFTWPVRCPAQFGELVRQRSPPALVILAHYAVLLHLSRDLWQIGPAAPRFLQVISDVLGPGYEARLAWPRGVVLGGGGGGICDHLGKAATMMRSG
ncbi:hypothetical protein PG997_001803 [Apiospora hydei]|uniref:Zn(2)-C6 fungal-type domain-containing protein n=1 Tax=Apiospora hydei TaxID=1337664 RepID=A0ABR1X7L9_9PEZI